MRYLIFILLALVACNKKDDKPDPDPVANSNQVQAPINYTVSIYARPFCGSGTLRVVWNTDTVSEAWEDSTYYYNGPNGNTFTKVVTSDSVRLYAIAKICGGCDPCNTQMTIKVNNVTVKESQTIKGDMFFIKTH